jgi:hypothetical protein
MSNFVKYSRLMLSCAVPDIAMAARYEKERAVDHLKDVQASLVGIDVATNSFTMRILDRKAFGDYIAGEAARFWLASMFSLVRASQSEEKSAAWQVIELYYAAYYAAHFVIRITGQSISQMDSAAANQVQRNNLTGTPFRPNAGLYKLEYKDLDNVRFVPVPKGGGSHKTAWASWESTITELLSHTTEDISEYFEQSISLIEHQKRISPGSYNTPSDIRAEINYQFKGQLWPFEERPKRYIEKINAMVLSSDKKISGGATQPEALIASAKYIIYLAHSLVDSSVKRYPKSILNMLHQKHLASYSSALEKLSGSEN